MNREKAGQLTLWKGTAPLILFFCGFSFAALAVADPTVATQKCAELPEFKIMTDASGLRKVHIHYSSADRARVGDILRISVKADLELKEFFNLSVTTPYRVYVAGSRQQFERLVGQKYDWKENWWVVGSYLSPNESVVLSPSLWDDRSAVYVDLKKLIKHEMAHSYSLSLLSKVPDSTCTIKKSTGGAFDGYTYWLEEGLATLVSGQLDDWKDRISDNLSAFPNLDYPTAASLVDYLIGTKGKRKILDAIRRMPPNYALSSCANQCDQIFFKTLDIANILDQEKQWQKFVKDKYK